MRSFEISILYTCGCCPFIFVTPWWWSYRRKNVADCKRSGKLHSRTGHEDSEATVEVWLYCFLDLGTKGVGWSKPLHAPAASPPRKRPEPIVQGAGWAPLPNSAGAENLATPGIRSPDRSPRSESLYQIRCPGPPCWLYDTYIKLLRSEWTFYISHYINAVFFSKLSLTMPLQLIRDL